MVLIVMVYIAGIVFTVKNDQMTIDPQLSILICIGFTIIIGVLLMIISNYLPAGRKKKITKIVGLYILIASAIGISLVII